MKIILHKLGMLIAGLLASLSAFAYDFEVDGIYYKVDSFEDMTCEVTSGYKEYTGDVVIPSDVTYDNTTLSVVAIGSSAFESCSSLKSVTLPNSIKAIGFRAFIGCSSLIELKIPDSVIFIQDDAFAGCSSLTSVKIGNSVNFLGHYSFLGCSSLMEISVAQDNQYYCSIDGVLFNKDCSTILVFPSSKCGECILPDSVTFIEDFAFLNCRYLTSVTIPASVTEIGYSAFSGFSSLMGISVAQDNQYFCSIDGVLFNKGSSTILVFPNARFQEYTIPYSVTEIGHNAFSGCNSLISVTIPDSVTKIGGGAFSGCSSLITVNIPDSVTEIGHNAFSGCNSLISVTIPDSVTEIGYEAFCGCSSLTSFFYNCINPCHSTYVVFDDFTFDNCTLYVPEAAVKKCKKIYPWADFKNIVAYDFSGVEAVSEDAAKTVTGRYDLSGSPVDGDYDGLVIMRFSDGTCKKMLNRRD